MSGPIPRAPRALRLRRLALFFAIGGALAPVRALEAMTTAAISSKEEFMISLYRSIYWTALGGLP